jgi:glutamyl/glutaminyl-tRNA synthetase
VSVRVRFAPRPLGRLRVADARTALFNWLYARRRGGTLVLRLRDADLEQPPPDGVQHIREGLRWLGLDWDEGPGAGGAHGPCVESARLALYRRYAQQLVSEGKAYPCTGSPQRPGQSPAVRLRCPADGQTVLSDLIFHERAFENAELGDTLLLDPDGRPTRHLADVVDDHHSRITHVIQDDGWLPSIPRQLLLYRALGWQPPRYAHLPPIAWPDRVDRDDRPGDGPIEAYREQGYLGPAVVNHLVRLGWSPRGKRELLALDELAARFDLGRVSHRPAIHDVEQLDWFNHRCLSRLDAAEVIRLLVPYWREAYGQADRAEGTGLAPAEWRRTLALAIRDELRSLSQAADLARFAFLDRVERRSRAEGLLAQPYAPQVLQAFLQGLPDLEPFAYERIDAFVSALRLRFKASHGVRSRDVMHVLRAALTGRLDGPCLVDVCQLLGRQRCLERANSVLHSRARCDIIQETRFVSE